jgi:RNA polymerase sigma factor
MENEPVLTGQDCAHAQLAEQVQIAKTDKHTLNTLLHDYMPFIKKCVSGVFFKGQSKEDNLTDAMLAFAHSVQSYNPEQGAFIQYAAAVIHNRLIDNARKESAVQKRLLSLSAKGDKKDIPWETGISRQVYNRAEEETNLRLEIEAANQEFSEWGFSWAALLKNCPKQDRSRRICLRIAEAVRQSPGLFADTLAARKLPVTRLAGTFPRKALEKYRQYIAALIIISRGDYPYVYSFVPQSRGQDPWAFEPGVQEPGGQDPWEEAGT